MKYFQNYPRKVASRKPRFPGLRIKLAEEIFG